MTNRSHGRTTSWAAAWVAAAVAATGAGCTTVHMKPPAEAGQGVEELRVQGLPLAHGWPFNEDFTIGLDRVSHVSRDVEERSRFRSFFTFERDVQTGYGYEVEHGGGTLHGECDVEGSTQGTAIGRLKIENRSVRIGCACGVPGAPPAATVVVGYGEGEPDGTLTLGPRPYPVTAIHDLAGGGVSRDEAAGYRVDGDGFVAAVDVMPPGHVWMDKTLEPEQRAGLDCLFAGLLLYVPLQPAAP